MQRHPYSSHTPLESLLSLSLTEELELVEACGERQVVALQVSMQDLRALVVG